MFSFQANLTFIIFPALSITIPNHQLVGADWDYNSNGSLVETSNTTKVYKMTQFDPNVPNRMPVFGIPLLSSSYLMVDHDSGNFNLSASIPTTRQDIVSFPNTACGGASNSKNADKTSISLSGSAIAGIVVGAVFGPLALIYILIFLRPWKSIPISFLRNASGKTKGESELDGSSSARTMSHTVEIDSSYITELASDPERDLSYHEKDQKDMGNPGYTIAFSELSGGYLPHELSG
jgi:hypothetical protein